LRYSCVGDKVAKTGESKLSEGVGSLMMHQDGFTCDGCGRAFERPIIATFLNSSQVQKYYACPRCMTEVKDADASDSDEGERTRSSLKQLKTSPIESKTSANCEHFFGYLKKREKDAPIPEECLMCGRMIECLLH
jgi:DNA-directed RNA polymerase subunit RPC12/RpoP